MPEAPAPRPAVARLAADAHGGPDYVELARLGLAPEDVLDFSASTNAFGPPPEVCAALAACDLGRYPDRSARPLAAALACHEGVCADQVLCANGAAQLIWSIALAYLQPGARVLIAGPTFGEYRVASQLMGGLVTEWRAATECAFMLDLEALAATAATLQPQVIWLCNPNNPTGTYLGEGAVVELMQAAPRALWVIDEAYRPFVDRPWPTAPLLARGNVVLLRSLTKDYALPGLRLGYALAAAPVVRTLGIVQPPWSVSAPAAAAGQAALGATSYVERTVAILRAEAPRLREALLAQGWLVLPSATHFFLLWAGDGATLRQHLLCEHHIQVRDCASFGLPGFVRIATRTPVENECLCAALATLQPARAG